MTLFSEPIAHMRTLRLQRGAGTLAITLILLLCVTLIGFSTSKSLLFEQKTSANQLRSTKAFEAAEAGIEWASAMLNDARSIDGSCAAVTTSGAISFQKTYLPYTAAAGFAPSTARPGCSMSIASGVPVFSCSCPPAGTAPSLASTTSPTFTVQFQAVNSTTVPGGTADPGSVLVTAYGCTAADSRCVPGSTNSSDAYQKISVILKFRPLLPNVPVGAIVAGGNVTLGSAAVSVENVDPATNGILVNSGGACCLHHDFANTTTLPGTPPENSVITGDTSLSELANNPDGQFRSFFGMSVAEYKANPQTKVLTAAMCGGDCEAKFNEFYNGGNGYKFFYLEDELQVSSGTIGSATNPVAIVTSSDIRFNGGTDVYGLIYGDSDNFSPSGLGSGTMYGAVVARNNFEVNSNPLFKYDPDVLKKLQEGSGSVLRVPGSWKDF